MAENLTGFVCREDGTGDVLYWKESFRRRKDLVPCYEDKTLVFVTKVKSRVISEVDAILSMLNTDEGVALLNFLSNDLPSQVTSPDLYTKDGDYKGLPKLRFVNDNVRAKSRSVNRDFNHREVHIMWNLAVHSKSKDLSALTMEGIKNLITNDMDQHGNLPILADVNIPNNLPEPRQTSPLKTTRKKVKSA